MFVSILEQGDFLIASIHAALDDEELIRFQDDLVEKIGITRAKGIIVDVAALDLIDSFATSTLLELARMARLRGAATVIVGIQPDAAFTMVRFGMTLDVPTALDLEQGLRVLEELTTGHRRGAAALSALRERTE